MSRAAFHQANQERANAEALRLLNARSELAARWYDWVAAELYHLSPPEYANMVRRALEHATLKS